MCHFNYILLMLFLHVGLPHTVFYAEELMLLFEEMITLPVRHANQLLAVF